MKKLLIVESPAKIKTISKFLGKDFTIVSTMGHIKDLPQKELGIKFNTTIDLDYEPLPGKEKVINAIKKEAKNSDEIYLAPDPDREGEIIAWHVEQEISKVLKKNSKIYRIAFNEITKTAIEAALVNPHEIDLDKVAAQQARRILDRLVGYEVSPVLWVKVAKGLSAGRVQSVALKLICDRETSIKEFKIEEYWSLEALFHTSSDHKFTALLTHINKKKAELPNKESTDKLIEKIKAADFKIDSIKDTKRLKNPYPPFMTSSLQQAAYNQLGFSVTKTMLVAQKLYEGIPLSDPSSPQALITYMRTDSLRISDVAIKQTRKFVLDNYGKNYLPVKEQIYSGTKAKLKTQAQDAHEAIRPIDININPESVYKYLSSDEFKLYELIWKRFVACQVKPAEYAQRQIVIEGIGPKANIFLFKVTGSTLIFDGYLKVYNDEPDQDQADKIERDKEGKVLLPAGLEENMPLKMEELLPKQHFTQPPPRYTEASLVKDLEKEGIGRPSTYATILKTIQARSYTELDTKKRFIPTELGIIVTNMLSKNLPQIMNISFTASMEEKLDEVAHGELNRDKLINSFYEEFEKELTIFRGAPKKIAEVTDLICPKCKLEKLIVRLGKTGQFLGCPTYPTCKFTSNFTRSEDNQFSLLEQGGPETLDEECPKCQSRLRKIQGRFGKFTSCSGYPKCNYIKQVKAGVNCPLCENGEIVEKSWKGKRFWTCSNYPKCKISFTGDIESQKCPNCSYKFMAKRGENLVCINKACNYKN